MIQITGLTKVYRRGRPPALLDLTFDVRPGMVTALLGPEESGKSTALRLMLDLERGQGVTLFGGRTYRTLRRPEREVGVVLPTVGAMAGHPGRTARGHLRMLAAAAGVPTGRADELLEQTRLATVAGHRLRVFSPGMNRRLILAGALLGTPGTLVLDAPTEGLSPRNIEWFHSFLRSFAVAGGSVLVTTRAPQEAARLADRVATLEQGRLVADQPVADFRRTRLRPEVSVRGPQMARLADLLLGQGALVRRDGAVGLAVSGIGRTEIGELAYRHGILLHELAERVVEQPAPRAALPASSGRSGQVQLHKARRAPDGQPSPASPVVPGPQTAPIPQAAHPPQVSPARQAALTAPAHRSPQAAQSSMSEPALTPSLAPAQVSAPGRPLPPTQALPVMQAPSGSTPSHLPPSPLAQQPPPAQQVPQGRQSSEPGYALRAASAGSTGAGTTSTAATGAPTAGTPAFDTPAFGTPSIGSPSIGSAATGTAFTSTPFTGATSGASALSRAGAHARPSDPATPATPAPLTGPDHRSE
ncbi:ATP-binding cassette domain-containing protein [Kitasatospora sp. NBC_00240]|uniref:ATP-binding cassette domain-containing protein n=1 Tax=Kitasatospora sp. NBC_00240 TaxID=2903567 RepID=UPI002259373A|nr:ATP-binding cassette domain-containing protein [Kitasatospora sp. NBC_00240]MCX5210505.1 ATP-binding cassette domain-containing protein [Kitasatospora sp. NBC_00240]